MAKHRFLVCVDSDGCMFDTMEIKHKECFCPAFIEWFGLQAVSKYAREAWEFVNLYSQGRGIQRFRALVRAMDLLRVRREVSERGFTPMELPGLRAYIASGGTLSNEGLKEYLAAHPEAEDIRTAIAWSEDVNARIARMVHGVPPFPHAREGLRLLSEAADIVVVSATPKEALEREWAEHNLTGLVTEICGQEIGSKKQIIAALKTGYGEGCALMIGDAPGDRDAGHAEGALFYPIRPNEEAEAWAELPRAAEAFFAGRYAGGMENEAIARFETLLPETPPWETKA